MKNFKEVLNSSKNQVLESRRLQIENEKIALLENIKSNLMITCKLKELSESKQKQILNMLLEYWSPKKGINRAGIKFLNENAMAITWESSPENIELFAKKEVRDHINEFVNAFVNNKGRMIVERLQNNIESRCKRHLKYENLFEMVSSMVSQKLKLDNQQ